jgi:GT2 family glycosyltransferase
VQRGHGVGLWRVRYPVSPHLQVSIIIPSGGNVALLERCLQGLERQTAHRNFEVVLVDNSHGDEIAAAFDRFRERWHACRYLDCRREPFDFSRLNNRAVKLAGSQYLLFLNDDVVPCSSDWLEALLEHAQRPEVGAVGPMLLYRDGTVQHAGITLGLNGCCDHGLKRVPANEVGYHNFHNLIRNCSAVTGACLLTRKDVFEQVGGFDEGHLPNAFQDVDLCLKIGKLGLRVVYTPCAKLYHDEGRTRKAAGLANVASFEEEIMRQRWGKFIAEDPCYNVNLSRRLPGYRIELPAPGEEHLSCAY